MGYVTKTHFLKQTHLGSLLESADPSEADFTATKGTSAAWPVLSANKVATSAAHPHRRTSVAYGITFPMPTILISAVVDHEILEILSGALDCHKRLWRGH